MKPRKPILSIVGTVIVFSASTISQSWSLEIAKLQNTNQLDNISSWSGGLVPGASDVMLWNSTYTTPGATASLSQMGTSLSVSGIKVTDVGGTRNLANTMVGYQNTSSGATLTIGAGGIDLSLATQPFLSQSRITIGANQDWKIGTASTVTNPTGFNNNEDLSFGALALGAAFDFGAKTVTTSGDGQATISSGYTLSNGVLNIGNNLMVIQGGGSRLTTIASTLGISIGNTSTLRLQSNSGAMTSNAPITVSGILNIHSNNGTQIVTQTGALTMNAGSSLNGSGGTNFASTSTYNLISGAIAVNGNINWNHTGASLSSLDVTGAISGIGNIEFKNTSTTSVVRWNGNNSAYSGTVSLSGASGIRVLRVNSTNAGSSAATWNVGAGNILQINGVSPSFGILNGAGTITNSHASSAATINVAAGNFSGVISNGTPVTNVVKTGAGTLVLSGANTYTGTTTVNGGALRVSSQATGASAVTVADTAAYIVSVASADDNIALTSLTTGTTTGCTVGIDNGVFPNPTIAPIFTTDLVVNSPTVIELTSASLTNGLFPLISYTNLTGTLGSGGLSVKLPPRVSGTIVNSPNSVAVNIDAVDGIRWKGNLSNDWDFDPVGDGSAGSLNWETKITPTATRFLQGAGGTDAALFDDNAAGAGDVTVNLTATHTPTSLSISNPTRNYSFTGTGAISGTTSLVKNGAGNLTIANTGTNTYTGGTNIQSGTITLGDGVTAGAGVIPGNIEVLGGLILNRPDDHAFSNILSGGGSLTKNQANNVTIATNLVLTGNLAHNAGTLTVPAGASISGIVSGAGAIELIGGNLLLSGADPNTHTGDINISTGILTLQKDPGVQAVGGNIYVTGAANGSLIVAANEQIADTADLHFLGSSGDPMVGSTGSETVENVFLNTSNGTAGQLVMKNTFTVTGTATLTSGIMGAGSGTTANIGAVVITSPLNTILRVAGNSAATTMNIGAGGVTAAGGDWQIKFNTADMDAIVNLGGNVTTTGDFIISNGGYAGVNRNVINLTGSRTFDIAAGTTTTVAPDFADDPLLTADTEDTFTGSLTKTGDGKLVIGASSTLGQSGATTVSAGTLILNGSAPNLPPALASGTTLGGTGSITASITIPSGATVAPGNGGVGTLNFETNLTLGSGSTYAVDITGAGTCDRLAASSGVIIANGTIAVTLNGYAPVVNDTFDIADAGTISGTPVFDFTAAVLGSGLAWDTSEFATTGIIKVVESIQGYDAFAAVIPNPDDRDPTDDPDGDGITNLMEYALNGVPTTSSQEILPDVTVTATDFIFTFTRNDASEADTTQTVEIGNTLDDLSIIVPIIPVGVLPPGVTVDLIENDAAPDSITVTISKGANERRFARFKVVK